MFMPIILLWGARRFIDTNDPDNLPMLRCIFVCSQAFLACVWAFVYWSIKNKNDMTKLKTKPSDFVPPNPMAEMMGVKNDDKDEVVSEMTVYDYDVKMLRTALQGLAMQCLIVGGIHYKWGTTLPLLITSGMGLINAASAPLIQIHVFRYAAVGPGLERPFKAPKNALQEMAEEQQQQLAAAAKETKTKEGAASSGVGSTTLKRRKQKSRKD
eukprot:g5572.t1